MAMFVVAVCATVLAQGQAATRPGPPDVAPQQAPAAQAGQPATPPDKLAPPEAFTYRPDGRRDPFVSLVNRSLFDNRPAAKKPEGAPGLSWDEISLVGIMQFKGKATAIVRAPDTKEYRLHVGDQLFDCVVKSITTDTLVVLQEVNDPLSLVKQRERRKSLRVVEEVK